MARERAITRKRVVAKAKGEYRALHKKGRRAESKRVGHRPRNAFTVNAPKQLW